MYQRIKEVVEPGLEPKERKVVEESVSDFRRVRLLYQTALMVSEMEALMAEDSEEVGELQPYAVGTTELIPVPIVWRDGGDKVFVTGTFATWQRGFKLHRR